MTANEVPELRFKGFTDPWKQRKLNEVAQRITRKNIDNESTLPLTISAEDGLVDQITYFNNRVASRNLSKYYLILNGEFAYNRSTSEGYPFGAIKRLNKYDKGVLSTLYTVFAIKDADSIDSNFLSTFFETNRWHNGVAECAAEGARTHGLLNISAEDFLDIAFFSPTKAEQEKVASFIEAVDSLKALIQQKYDKLCNFKKAMLEKMFPKEGESVPEIRFEGFDEPWEQYKLLDCIQKIIDFRGRTPRKLGMDWAETGYLALSALNVKDGYIDFSQVAHYGDQQLYDTWMKGNELHRGQVLFTTEAPMGNVAQIPDNNKYILSQRTVAFEVKSALLDEDFLAVLLKSPRILSTLVSLLSGGTAKGVSQKSLSEITCSIPFSKVEQQKIGFLFHKLDSLVSNCKRKLEVLNNLKKALLDKMFV